MTYSKRVFYFFLIDTFLLFFSIMICYLLRFEGKIPTEFLLSVPYAFLLIWVTTCIIFLSSNFYRRIWKYAGVGELISLVKLTTVSIAVDFVLYILLKKLGINIIIPRSIFPLAWMTIILSIGGSRFVWRAIRDHYTKIKPYHKRVLIFGAGKAGALIAKELKHYENSNFYPVAFIDDDPTKLKLEIIGISVVGNRNELISTIEKYDIDTVVIAIPSAPRKEISSVIEICKNTNVDIKLLPRVSDVIHGNVSVTMIRDVNLEDLLGRDEVAVDLEQIAGYVSGKIVLVTGAGGSIGSELCRQLAIYKPKQLLLLGHGENSIYAIENELKSRYPDLSYETIIADIQHKRRLEEVFSSYKPSVVFHAAAHKHVPLMEKNPIEAIKNNVFGTKNVADCAHTHNVERFVLISSDKAVNPTSIMGATKQLAEKIIQNLNSISDTKFVAVRFGNVLGSRGSVIPLFKQQIESGGPVTVTHPDMIRYFMTIPEAAQLVIQAGAFAKDGEVFILDMGKPVKIVDLAKDLIRLSGLELDKDIRIEFTGIRPGEKLFEELLTDEEGTTATKHNRIFVGKPSYLSNEDLIFMLKKLEHIIDRRNDSIPQEEIKVFLLSLVDVSTKNASESDKNNIMEVVRAAREVAVAGEEN